MFVVHEKDGKKTAADAFLFTYVVCVAILCGFGIGHEPAKRKIPIAQKRTSTWPVVRYILKRPRKPYTERGR